MSDSVRVRFAPSPTGYLHVGGARSALFCWLFARHNNGTFILRVEDTDQERSTEEALQMQLGDLKWLGLNWDEGAGAGGDYGPYKQSERLEIYKKYSDQLLESGKAYYCFCKDEELQSKREKAQQEGRSLHYDGTCRSVSLEDAKKRLASGETAAVRFRIEEPKDYVVNDLIRGEVTFPSDMVGDFIVLRSDGMPVYNFCCVVDDWQMKMTHVLRAEEHLSNTLRQMMLYEALDAPIPQFGHMSIILGEDKQKLSKRHGATSVRDYAERGYLPEGLINYLSLLGWSSPSGEEVLTVEDLVSQFTLDRVNSSPAVFDEKKLIHFNATHLRSLDHTDLWNRLKPFLDASDIELYDEPEWQTRAVEVLKVKMETLQDGVAALEPLSDKHFQITEKGRETLAWEETPKVIQAWKGFVEEMDQEFMTPDQFDQIQDKVKESCGVKGKFLFMPIRVGVIGHPQGAEMKQLAPLLKKSSLLDRANQVLSVLGL